MKGKDMSSTGRRAGWMVMVGLGALSSLRGNDPYQPPGIQWEHEYDWHGTLRFFPIEEGGGIVEGHTDHHFFARITSEGEIVWSRSAPGYLPTPSIPTPTLSGDQFVLPFGDEGSTLSQLVSMSANGEVLWEKSIQDPLFHNPTYAFRSAAGSF